MCNMHVRSRFLSLSLPLNININIYMYIVYGKSWHFFAIATSSLYSSTFVLPQRITLLVSIYVCVFFLSSSSFWKIHSFNWHSKRNFKEVRKSGKIKQKPVRMRRLILKKQTNKQTNYMNRNWCMWWVSHKCQTKQWKSEKKEHKNTKTATASRNNANRDCTQVFTRLNWHNYLKRSGSKSPIWQKKSPHTHTHTLNGIIVIMSL